MLLGPNSSFLSFIEEIALLSSLITYASATAEYPVDSTGGWRSRVNHERDRTWNRQIRCIGPMFPGVTADMTGGQTSFTTPRKFCASQAYGGLPEFNMGGFCDRFHGLPVVRFSKLPDNRLGYPGFEDLISAWLPYRRFYDKSLTFCRLRCRCIADRVLPAHRRRRPAIEILDSERIEDPATYDVNPVYTYTNDPVPAQFEGVHFLKVAIGTEMTYQSEGIRFWTIGSRLDHRSPHCVDLFPALYPQPFDRGLFASTNDLCVSIFHGGSPLGNAGAVCHLTHEPPSDIPIFQLKLLGYLSHPSFLATNGDLGLAINIWCRSICSCSPNEGNQQRESVPVKLNEDRELMATFKDGKVYIKNLDGSDPDPRGPTILGESRNGGAAGRSSRTCSLLGIDICLDPVLEDEAADGQCRFGDCNGPAQCGGSSCQCVAHPSLELMQQAGYGPGLPRPSALCIGTVVLGLALHLEKGTLNSRLLGRDASPIGCPCNQTYVSGACCDAGTKGLVWEDLEMRLGSLDQDSYVL